jgi:hypothetical protein
VTTKHDGVPSERDDRRPLADRVEDLDGFIPVLRGRLGRGEYAECGPVDLGEWAPLGNPERVLRVMLADWDHFHDLSPAQRDDFQVAARRLAVLRDLRLFLQRLDASRG